MFGNPEPLAVYIAHPLGLMKELKEKKIENMISSLGLVPLNPFEERIKEFDYMIRTVEDIRNFFTQDVYTEKWIVEKDLAKLSKAKGVLVYMPQELSIGCLFEAAFAVYQMGIPVAFVVNEKYLDHPWLRFMGVCVGKAEDLNKILRNLKIIMLEKFR